ncbi:MAG: pyrroline-5-carboxylate reductase [Alcaligenaceae bacterium]|nr:pyrroline-5-carboxylate reductase [Alcaligenaceae bacterium]
MNTELTLAFIGGGNMASALGAGLIGKRCGAHDVLVIDPNESTLQNWSAQGTRTAFKPGPELAEHRVWILAVKPQSLREAVQQCKPFLTPETLVISVAAGISATTLSQWLGEPGQPFQRIVRCMPNTPALIGAGASGLMALEKVSADDRRVAEFMVKAVGEYVWVENDAQIDTVTALSGSGPAYVFLFLESMIESATRMGLPPDQARKLALATVSGATQLAALSPETLATLRERVTSKGGTTAAALDAFAVRGFNGTIDAAMQAARDRAETLSAELSR